MNRIEKTIPTSLKITIILVTLLAFNSCDPADNRLKIINDSNSDIYFAFSCDSSLDKVQIFRNRYYSNSVGDSVYMTSNEFVEKKSHKNIVKRFGTNAWIYYVKKCPNQKISFYFFLDSIVRKYSDTAIKDNRLFEKHIIMSLNDLKRNDWIVKFP